MQRYIVLYRAPLSVAQRFAQATPAEAAEGMKLWTAWHDRIGDNLIDPGGPLGNARRVGPTAVAPTNTDIIGMSILQADSIDAALTMVSNHHHLHWAPNCEILLLEEQPIPELQQ
ncbi:hypothetical protein VMT65_22945 [Nocardia sp. CDC153]|uniref:hypothetical protein n=1 Tax=Nocardia sp. CDC153 TaxID=3112167 RepID=UPI002DBD08F2|nr:hypothetical protein [Nocardia sp. CDC153]MEC3955910.1 hypothetical protein [Nocardia sp. CDC153]